METRGPSQTARRVAAHRLAFLRLDAPYGRAHDDELLASDVAGGIAVRREGMHRYLRARTSFFDHVVVESIASGIDQVVLLGAGYDGRSLRYAHDDVRYFEVDLAATQADKLERLARLRIDASKVTFLAADFARDDVGATLVAAGLAERPALLVLEGVVPYLEPATFERLLGSMAAVTKTGSVLAVSVGVDHPPDDLDAAARVAAFRATVDALGEPARSWLTRDGVRALVVRTGWVPDEHLLLADHDDSARRAALGLLVARRAD